MGDFMRQYWIPALASTEIEPDGAPRRLMLLGEKLIAFRDSSGRVGVMDHRCPHRCASLFLGRNENDGLRCIYHGWKFDVDGNCVDMPSVPPHQDFKEKVKAKVYKVTERSGMIWVYMGSRDQPPPFPLIEAAHLAEADLQITLIQRDCNWMQSLEGDVDTSHFGFLHVGSLNPDDVPSGHPLEFTASERAPEYHVKDTPWGTSYGAYRAVEPGRTYWRFANFMFPFWTQIPQGQFPLNVHARAWVPIDDEHTMYIFFRWRNDMPGSNSPLKSGAALPGSSPVRYAPVSTDWLGRWCVLANAGNDWMVDRVAQKTGGLFSGIESIHIQDQAVTESMGPITNHDLEHLGPGDQMIARTRRRILGAARAFRDAGTIPPGVDNPEVYLSSRSGYFLADESQEWQAAYEQQVKSAERPVSLKALDQPGD
jgi:phenylpropionate dioxygenase-like ring-hydroxylating dioxygenase large terminal subunit